MCWEFGSRFIKIHNTLSKLNKTSFRGITFAMSVDISQFLFSSLQSGSRISLGRSIKCNSLKGSNGDFLLSSIELFAFIISWVILEDRVSTKYNCLYKSSESCILWVVTEINFCILLIQWFFLISLVNLEVS